MAVAAALRALCAALRGLAPLLLACVLLPGAARAETFAVDWALRYCERNSLGNSALAISDFGTYWCAWDRTTMAAARAAAVKGCRDYLPAELRAPGNCRVIQESRRVTDAASVAQLRKPLRMPVRMEAHDAGTGRTDRLDGFLVLGAAPDEITRTARILLADGTEACLGSGKFRSLKADFTFQATCRDGGVFRGEGRITGVRRIDGLNRLAMDLTIRRGGNWLRIVTK